MRIQHAAAAPADDRAEAASSPPRTAPVVPLPAGATQGAARRAARRRAGDVTGEAAAVGARAWPYLVLLIGVATAASRIPFRSRYLFSWDSANFALALDRYNVAFHQPQPPGYPLYVASAHLARLVFGDANTSYVALSVAASGVATSCLALVAARLYGRATALLAAALLATSSVFWSQGEVAYPYAFLACFSSFVAWLCAAVYDEPPARAGRLTVAAGLTIGVAGGFRSELIPFLLPLWLYVAVRRRAPWRERVKATCAGFVVLVAAAVAWYVPMVWLSGGWQAYQQATGNYYAYFIQTTSGAGKLLLGLLENTRALVGFLYNGLGLALVPVVYFFGRFFSPPRIVVDRRVRFLLLWLLPPAAFYVTVHIGNPGYVLSLLPGLCIYAAEATLGVVDDLRQAGASLVSPGGRWPRLVWLAEGRWAMPAAALLVVGAGLTNTALFLVASGEGRYQEIRQIDRIFSRQLAFIRNSLAGEGVLIIAYDRSRQYHYYLPQQRITLLFDVAVAGAVTDTSRYWERRTTMTVPADVTIVLFPDLGRNTSDQPGLVQHVDLGDGVDLSLARVRPGDEVRYGYQYATAQART